MKDIALRLDRIGKYYPRVLRAHLLADRIRQAANAEWFWALREVSAEIHRGETVGLVGRNGAGKTTLLRILSRVTPPTEGRAEVRGRIGALLEVGTGLHPELTGRENIYFNGALLGMRESQVRRKLDEIVAFAEIEQALDTPYKWYSSGMKARLGFSVAAHLDSDILFIDEALAVGDAHFRQRAADKLRDIMRSDRTVLFTGHQSDILRSLCDRAIWLDGGRVRACGKADEVVADYLAAEVDEPRPEPAR